MIRKTDSEGKLHCDDGPAVIADDGSFVYYSHGVIHRVDGPAVRLVFGNDRVEEQRWLFGREVMRTASDCV